MPHGRITHQRSGRHKIVTIIILPSSCSSPSKRCELEMNLVLLVLAFPLATNAWLPWGNVGYGNNHGGGLLGGVYDLVARPLFGGGSYPQYRPPPSIDPYPSYPAPENIYGGEEADEGQFPYLVSVQVIPNQTTTGSAYKGRWFPNSPKYDMIPACGGALLNPYTILTAAHCQKSFKNGSIFLGVAGEYFFFEDDGHEQNRTLLPLKHPNYNSSEHHDDIALYFTLPNRPFVITEFVKTIPLLPKDFEPSGTGIVAGWGCDEKIPYFNESCVSYAPNWVNITYLDDSVCVNHQNFSKYYDSNTMICAGDLTGVGTCNGDSGSPLVSPYPGEKYGVVTGIVSYGKPSCGYGVTAFTKVSAYGDWIEEKIGVYYEALRQSQGDLKKFSAYIRKHLFG